MLQQACSSTDDNVAYVGYIEADLAYVAAPQAGWINSLNTMAGSTIAAGDVLFILDQEQQIARHAEAVSRVAQSDAQVRDISTGARPAEIAVMQARLQEAQAQLSQAAAEKTRWTDLARRGLASSSQGEQAGEQHEVTKARVAAAERTIEAARLAGRDAAKDAAIAARTAAEASLSLAQWQLDQRTVHARLGGRIEELFHSAGEFVQAGTPVAAILPVDSLKVRFFVPQAELPGMIPGSHVLVKADGIDEELKSTVSFVASDAEFTPPVIYSAASRDSLVFMVEAHLPVYAGLRPGLPVDVRLP
jgi:HlyD family secretion protein